MDSLEFLSLIGILVNYQPLSVTPQGLQLRTGRRKRLRTVSEISIPIYPRDFRGPREGLPAHQTPVYTVYNTVCSFCSKKKWSSDTDLIKSCYAKRARRLQRLRSGTEPRWTVPSFLSDAPKIPFELPAFMNITQLEFSYMKYKQLELFDLSLYTSESTPEVDWKESQVEETSVCVQYEQLELDLFPQPSHKTIIEFVRLAA